MIRMEGKCQNGYVDIWHWASSTAKDMLAAVSFPKLPVECSAFSSYSKCVVALMLPNLRPEDK